MKQSLPIFMEKREELTKEEVDEGAPSLPGYVRNRQACKGRSTHHIGRLLMSNIEKLVHVYAPSDEFSFVVVFRHVQHRCELVNESNRFVSSGIADWRGHYPQQAPWKLKMADPLLTIRHLETLECRKSWELLSRHLYGRIQYQV